MTLRAHALFNLCDGGPCRFLRKDLEIVVPLAQ